MLLGLHLFQVFGGSARRSSVEHNEEIQKVNQALEYIVEKNHPTDMILILEPWAEEFSVPSGSKICVNILYVKEGSITIDTNPKYYVIWLWAGCRATVFIDGVEKTPASLSIPSF